MAAAAAVCACGCVCVYVCVYVCVCVCVKVELLVLRSLSHYLLLPWSASPLDTQDWEQRSARLTLLLQRTLHDYVMLSHQLISTHHHHHQAPPAQILLSGRLHYALPTLSTAVLCVLFTLHAPQ